MSEAEPQLQVLAALPQYLVNDLDLVRADLLYLIAHGSPAPRIRLNVPTSSAANSRPQPARKNKSILARVLPPSGERPRHVAPIEARVPTGFRLGLSLGAHHSLQQGSENRQKDGCSIQCRGMKTESKSLAQRILSSKRPFTFFHTWTVTRELLGEAIKQEKSMDLDVCVDDEGNPYLGHAQEYHEKSGEPYFESMPLWEAVDWISRSDIVVLVDCKHYEAWPVIDEVVARVGPERCRVDSYVSELKFGHSRKDGEPDFLAEWSPIEKLRLLKERFPSITTTACAKWPPTDLLVSDKHERLVKYTRAILKDNHIDVVCLGVPDETVTDKWLRISWLKTLFRASKSTKWTQQG